MTVFGPQPAGLINDVPGFSPNGIFVSFNRGRTWRSVTVPTLPPPCPAAGVCTDPTGFLEGGDPEITAGPNGTFYFGEDVVHFATGFGPPNPGTIAQDAGIATSISTDGGLTWSTPVLSGTAADRPFITTDASTGTVYIESGAGPLGSGSTANPDSPNTAPAGRYLVASGDGRHWTSPAPLPAGISGPYISAANGELVTGGRSTSTTVCGGQAACELLDTTANDGATWSQFAVPNSSDSARSGPLVAADPTRPDHITVAFLNSANTSLTVLQTHDGGSTWSTPTSVAENANIHWKPWMAYGPDGTLGLMWRTWTGAANTSSYNVWAAISFDGGSTFTKPLEVSNGDSPPPNSALLFPTFADDFSNITLDRQDAFVSWADWRPGGGTQRQGFISEVKLQAFKFSDR
jgi:BNR repeat protein